MLNFTLNLPSNSSHGSIRNWLTHRKGEFIACEQLQSLSPFTFQFAVLYTQIKVCGHTSHTLLHNALSWIGHRSQTYLHTLCRSVTHSQLAQLAIYSNFLVLCATVAHFAPC